MPQLTITDGDKTIVSLAIADVDPSAATVAILTALSKLSKPRRTRSDKGKPRTEAAP